MASRLVLNLRGLYYRSTAGYNLHSGAYTFTDYISPVIRPGPYSPSPAQLEMREISSSACEPFYTNHGSIPSQMDGIPERIDDWQEDHEDQCAEMNAAGRNNFKTILARADAFMDPRVNKRNSGRIGSVGYEDGRMRAPDDRHEKIDNGRR